MTDRVHRLLGLFEAALPIGRAVRYFPVDGEAEFVTSIIASKPWALGHGEIIIKIAGKAGGVLVSHLELVGGP